MAVLQIILLLIIPYGIQILCARIQPFRFIGTAITCFLIGVLLGNVLPEGYYQPKATQSFYEVLVPLGSVLMLVSTDISKWIKVSLITMGSFIFQVLSVIISVIIGFIIFRSTLSDLPLIAGMITGTYIGGSPNLSAVQLALGAPPEMFTRVFLSDMCASIPYLVFIMVFAAKLLRPFLPPFRGISESEKQLQTEEKKFYEFGVIKRIQFIGVGILLALLVTIIPIGLHVLYSGSVEGINMAFLILSITVISVLLSFVPQVRNLPGSFEVGDYLFNAFFLCMGTLTQLHLLIQVDVQLLMFTAVSLYGSFILHFIAAWLFKIDRDTFIITSVAGIMSPPFIPAVASSLQNREIIVPGMAVSIVGLAAGNIFGISIATYLLNYT
ncbi:MAG: DUF819 family protein [Flavobacteriales bacterium]|nr:DUF819 family protein [Flavobacteriales bacterium]